jgi:hypothetical protein
VKFGVFPTLAATYERRFIIPKIKTGCREMHFKIGHFDHQNPLGFGIGLCPLFKDVFNNPILSTV